MTADEKLEAIFEAGFVFNLCGRLYGRGKLIKVELKINDEGIGWWRTPDEDFTDIKSAVDWLYENTVGKK